MRLPNVLSRLQGPGWSVVDQSFVSAVNFLSIFLLARAMAPTDFGVFMVAYTGLLFLIGLQHAFVIQPHNYMGAPLQHQEFARFTGMLALMQLISSGGVCLLLAVAGLLVLASGFAHYGMVVVALAAIAFPWLMHGFIRRAFYTKGRAKSAALNGLVSYGLQLAGVIWLTQVFPSPSPVSVLLIYGGASFIAALFGVLQMRHWFDFSGAGSLLIRLQQTSRKVWDFGKWLVAQNMVGWFGMGGDTWVIAGILGTEAVGIFRAVVHLSGVLNPLRQAAAAYLPARASLALHHGGRQRLAKWVRRTTLWLQVAVLPIALTMMLFPGVILQLAYGDRFSGYETLLALDAVACVFEFLRPPLGMALLAMMASRAMFKIHLVPVLLLPILMVPLVWFFGIFGVPWFHIVAAGSTLFVTLWFYRRHIRHDRPAVAVEPAEWQPSKGG
ncbi:MAG: lipopolysaccharide biosynthesis protein [Burkholderiales bacterium]